MYFNDFETAVGPELATTGAGLAIDRTPTASRGFLGEADANPTLGLSNETVTLTLTGLAAHSDVTVSLKLFIIQSWDGNGSAGPDVWQAGHSGSLTNLQQTTFGIAQGPQCYPVDCPASNAARTGASEANDSLGYGFFGDNVYDLTYTFTHTASTLIIQFSALGLQEIGDESWGIDNLRVDVTPINAAVPEPATWVLLASGLCGLVGWHRRSAQRRRRAVDVTS